MKAKIIAIWLTALTLLPAVLFALAVQAEQAGYANLLMARPNSPGTPDLRPERLEEFSEEEFLLTYEMRSAVTAEAIHSKHSANLIGTNHNYADMMRYAILDGGFFTKAAMDAESKHVTLNETAAFRMFGSNRITGSKLRIGGETWIVAGVVQDNDEENLNLYAPASVTGGQADSVMILLDDAVTEAYAKNALKRIGIRDNSYGFVNLSRSADAFYERFSVAWQAAVLAGVLLLILRAGGTIPEAIRFYRNQMRTMYLREMLAAHRKGLLKAVCTAAVFAAGIAAAMRLSLQILETCLTWQELTDITGELVAGDFGQKLLWLRDFEGLDHILFRLCICTAVAGLSFMLFHRRGSASGKRPRYRLKAGHIRDYRIS